MQPWVRFLNIHVIVDLMDTNELEIFLGECSVLEIGCFLVDGTIRPD